MHWYTDQKLKIQTYTSTGKKATLLVVWVALIIVMMEITDSLMLRCWLESNCLCAGAWGNRNSVSGAREVLTFGYCGLKMFKVHTDSGWRVRVSPKKLSGKKIWGCWCRIAGCGWRLWQFAKLWSQTILRDFLVLKMIGVRKSLSRIAGLLDWCLNLTEVQQLKKLKRGHWIFLLGLS